MYITFQTRSTWILLHVVYIYISVVTCTFKNGFKVQRIGPYNCSKAITTCQKCANFMTYSREVLHILWFNNIKGQHYYYIIGNCNDNFNSCKYWKQKYLYCLPTEKHGYEEATNTNFIVVVWSNWGLNSWSTALTPLHHPSHTMITNYQRKWMTCSTSWDSTVFFIHNYF